MSEQKKNYDEDLGLRVLSEISLTDEELEKTRFEVLKIGQFYDARYGKFAITKDLLATLKANFDNRVLGIDVALDVNHEPDKGAKAWINTLDVQGDSLYATFKDFTEEAKRFFREKIYRYFSVEFSPFAKVEGGKKVTIKDVLRGIALTNRPVIKGMQPTFLSEDADKSIISNRNMNALKVLCEHLVQRGNVTKDDVAAVRVAFAALSEDEQTEAKTDVANVEAEAAKTAEAEAKAKADKEAADKAAAEAGKTPEAASAADLAEVNVKLAEKEKEIAALMADKTKRVLAEHVSELTLSEDNLSGFTSDSEAKLSEFVATLSEAQYAAFKELVPLVRTTTKTALSEIGSGKDASKTATEEAKLAEAKTLAEKKIKDSGMLPHVALAEAYKELGIV